MIKNIILLIFIFLLGSQVTSSQSKKGSLPVFDLSKNYPQKKLVLQNIADIEYVPLETTDDVLLSGRAVLSYISDKYILLYEPTLGDIFVFDRMGRLYSHFNHLGQSGSEYQWIKTGVILDEKKEEIYVCSQAIQVYSLHGTYKRTLKINTFESEMNIFNFDDKSLLIYEDVNIERGHKHKTKKDPYRLVSKKDGSLLSVLPIHLPKRYSNAIPIIEKSSWHAIKFGYPWNPYYGQDLMIADISSDTLFLVGPGKGVTPILTRKPSVHAADPKNVWTIFVTTDKFILIGMILLDFNSKGGKIPLFMYEYETGEISRVSISDSELDTNPLGTGRWGPDASPAIPKNRVAELFQASAILEAYKGKRLKGNGEQVAKQLVEDDNPVIRILKFK